MLQIVAFIFQALNILILARVIISWIRPNPANETIRSIIQFVHQATEPLLEPIRRILPPMGGLDFSPIILLLGLNLIQNIILGAL